MPEEVSVMLKRTAFIVFSFLLFVQDCNFKASEPSQIISTKFQEKNELFLSKDTEKNSSQPKGFISNILNFWWQPESNSSSKNLSFYYFSRAHPKGVLLKSVGKIQNKETKIIVHGYLSDVNQESVTGIRDAYLQKKDVNIIMVDWSEMASNINYVEAANKVSTVGLKIGQFINKLTEEGNISYEKVHIIGFSLGAHAAGMAGRNTFKSVARITGLDPAGPCFEVFLVCGFSRKVKGLGKRDATFVDVIHTGPGILGISKAVGHVDFFPNGRPLQPACYDKSRDEKQNRRYRKGFQIKRRGMFDWSEYCNHQMATKYYAESISNPNFLAIQCDRWEDFQKKNCRKIYQYMGDNAESDKPGIFFLETNAIKSFAMGKKGILNQ